MVRLTKEDVVEMGLLIRNPKYGSSDRHRDKQRMRLKRLGCIAFDRTKWEWTITDLGRQALEAHMEADNG